VIAMVAAAARRLRRREQRSRGLDREQGGDGRTRDALQLKTSLHQADLTRRPGGVNARCVRRGSLPRMADVVIVGAGVVGASIAWHLAQLGVRDVLLLDGAEPGQGSTGRATGGFRAQHATEIDVRLSLLSREKLLRFRDEVGADPGYEPRGYLFVAPGEAELRRLREAIAVQRAVGLSESRWFEGDAEIVRLNPYVRAPGAAGGAFCPIDGYIRPMDILRGYLDGARLLGVAVRSGARVEALRVEQGRVVSLRAGGEDVSAGIVVDAAGPWAAEVAALADVTVPVAPLRRQVAVTMPTDALPREMPMTIFLDDSFHLRARDGRVLLLRPTPGNPRDPFDTSVEDGWIEEIARMAARRVPALARVPIDRPRCWAGLYEMTPDGHAILGFADAVPNLLLACGNSGHGVMHAPALGQLAAELIVHGAPRSLDVAALRPSRFDEGAAPAAPLL
jgi:sarcosine oxidase, subunit beta